MEKQNTPRPWVVFTIAAEVVMLLIHQATEKMG
jgi:hypothetical protein